MTDPCGEIQALLGNGGFDVCWPGARNQLNGMMAVFYELFACNQASCIKTVPSETAIADFLDTGWSGDVPDNTACPLLWVIRGCEVFVGVNSPACNLAAGTGWIPVTSVPKKALIKRYTAIPQTVNPPNVGDRLTVTPALTWAKRPIGSVDYDTGIGVSIVNDEFILDPGEYVIQAILDTTTMLPAVRTVGMRIYDVTNAASLNEHVTSVGLPGLPQAMRVATLQALNVRVSLSIQTTFRIECEFSSFNPPPASAVDNWAANNSVEILIARD